jgi:DnaD/phage-associated family protein
MIKFKVTAGVTPVSNTFIEQYMPKAATAMFSVIYIYALKRATSGEETSNDLIAQALGILESDVIKAWEYWAEVGVIALNRTQDSFEIEFLNLDKQAAITPTNTAVGFAPRSEAPTYSMADIEQYFTQYPQLDGLVKTVERVHGQPFSRDDVGTVVSFYVWLGLSEEVIMVLFGHCKGKPMRYIEKTAINWADMGINSSDAAMDYLNTHFNKYKEIMAAFGVSGRAPGEKEQKIIDNWLFKLKMPMELIKLACDKALMRTGTVSFEYADSIIKNWHNNGVTTLSQAENADMAYKQKKAAAANQQAQTQAQKQPKPNKFINYDQPVYSAEQIQAAIARKKQRQKEAEGK